MTVRKIGNATIEKVEEICGAGFKPARMFPKFNQEAFDAQKDWMVPDHVEPGSDRLVEIGRASCRERVYGLV